MTASRRLQLAAEGSGVIGLALRRWRRRAEASEFKYPTASVTRWRVSALPSARYPFRASDAPDGGSNWSGVEPGSPRLSSWRRATLRVDSLCLRSCTIDRYQWHGHACRARHCRSLSPRTPANCSPSPRESLGFSLAVFEFGAHGSSLSTRSSGRPAHLHGLLPPILSAHGHDLAHLLWYVYRHLFLLSRCLLSGCTHRRYDHNDRDRG